MRNFFWAAIQQSKPNISTLTSGLIHYWGLNETNGSVLALDSIGNLNLPITSGVLSGDVEQGISLNGTEQYLTFPTSVTKDLSELTISMVIYPTNNSVVQSIWGELLSSNTREFSITTTTWATRDSSTGDFGARDNDLTLPTLTYNAWNHLVFVYSVSGSLKKIYNNVSSTVSTSTSIDTLSTNRNLLWIGKEVDNTTEFTGKIKKVAVWNRALNLSEVTELYNGGTVKVYPFGNTPVQPPLPPVENGYLEPINIPAYDPQDSTHFMITTGNNGFAQINNSSYVHFYVQPGSYGKISITRSGTVNNPRTISLYGSGDTHPAKLADNLQANVNLDFTNCDNWVIDRLSSLNYSDVWSRSSYKLYPCCHNIIFNRVHAKNFCRVFDITSDTRTVGNTDNIVIQNCRLDTMANIAIDADNSAIFLLGSNINTFTKVSNCRIVNNEIINCNDGIQTLRIVSPTWVNVNYEGLVIDNNHIYVTSALYTDGAGNLTPTGNYAFTENAIDLKGGSDNPLNPIVITNNKFWGYRRTDINGGGSGDWGDALVCHYETHNVVIEDNLFYDSTNGIVMSDPYNQNYSVRNVSIKRNIFANIGIVNTHPGYNLPIWCGNIYNVDIQNNIFTNSVVKRNFILTYLNETNGINFDNNVLIYNLGISGTLSQISRQGNYYYNSTRDSINDGNNYSTISEAKMSDLVFTVNKFNNDTTTTKTITGAVSTVNSPHWGIA